jgi:beta-glucosidase
VFVATATGGIAWKSAFARAKSLVDQMTVEEKVTVVTGQTGPCEGNTGAVERLGVPSMCLQDGPAGPRPIIGSSQFSAGVAAAATWDRDLIYQRGHAMGQEFHDQCVKYSESSC